eukprot:UN01776
MQKFFNYCNNLPKNIWLEYVTKLVRILLKQKIWSYYDTEWSNHVFLKNKGILWNIVFELFSLLHEDGIKIT